MENPVYDGMNPFAVCACKYRQIPRPFGALPLVSLKACRTGTVWQNRHSSSLSENPVA